MTPEEFVIWFRGFVTAANPYNITPKQWDDIKEQLEKVNENSEGRKVFYVDVGDMSFKEAEEYLSKIGAYDKKSYLEKVVEGIGVAGSFGGFNVN